MKLFVPAVQLVTDFTVCTPFSWRSTFGALSTAAAVNWSEGWLPKRISVLLRFRFSPRLSSPICFVEKFGNFVW
jgi:hypothetical protein